MKVLLVVAAMFMLVIGLPFQAQAQGLPITIRASVALQVLQQAADLYSHMEDCTGGVKSPCPKAISDADMVTVRRLVGNAYAKGADQLTAVTAMSTLMAELSSKGRVLLLPHIQTVLAIFAPAPPKDDQ